MKKTVTGYPINKNGKVLIQPKPSERIELDYKGSSFKESGIYFYYEGKRGSFYIYST